MTIRVPSKKESGYWAGKKIHATGPMLPVELYTFSEMGQKVSHRQTALDRSIESGWLVTLPDGRVGLSDLARDRYEQEAPEPDPAPTGSMATPREVKPFRPMSPQYRVNSRGPRADAPDCSVKAKPSHYAKVTP